MSKKKFTIFVTNGRSVTVESSKIRKSFWHAIIRIFRLTVDICYFFGSSFIDAAEFVVGAVGKEFGRTGTALRRRIQKLGERQFRVSIGVLLIFMAVVAIGFKSLDLVAYGLVLKDKIVALASRGGLHLQNAQSAIGGQNVVLAENEFRRAQESFLSSRQQLAEAGVLLNTVASLVPQKRDVENILDASDLVAKSGLAMTRFYDSVSQVRLTSAGIVSRGEPVSAVVSNVERGLNDAVGYLEEAKAKADKVNPDRVPESFRPQVLDMQEKLRTLTTALGSLREVFFIAKGMLMGDKHILLILENNNELRPTGGFMGSYGALDIRDGYIEHMRISSIYDLDGQLSERIVPPTPLLSVNDRWYLRDSNWFAHLPLSAKKIIGFYEKEGGETPDAIVVLTTNVVVELLKITGPVDMPSYGITLSAENFVEQTQVQTSVQQNSPVNEPKQILADFFQVLLQRLSENPAHVPALADAIQRQTASKHLAFFSRDKETQTRLESFNWAGSLAATDRDYLMVNTANFSGSKTDLSISQETELAVEIFENGDIVNTLTLRRSNTLPPRPETVNDSFIRFYVPEGSQLIESSGFDLKRFDFETDSDKAKEDGDVKRWEQEVKRDVVTGMYSGVETGKSFFGNWVKLEGGQAREVKIRYKLPFTLKDTDRYSLLVQKQMGSGDFPLRIQVTYHGRSVAWKNFDPDELTADSATMASVLSKDMFLGMVLKSN